MPVATAAAEPLDDPPGVCVTRCGFAVAPGVKHASSAVTVLPSTVRARGAEQRDGRGVGVRPEARWIGEPYSVG